MKIGIVSDIHCNADALRKAFALMEPVDDLFCLGDCINQYRFSNEVVALLRERNVHTILGNHEETFFSHVGEKARAAAWIEPELMQWLSEQPRQRLIERAGKQIHVVHSTPWAPHRDYVYPQDRGFERFGDTTADIVLYGHTHQPVVRRVNGTLVVNPGSAGHGRNTGTGWELSCAVLDIAADDAHIISFSE